MSTTETNGLIPPQAMAELQAAADRAPKALCDPEIRTEACERMDRLCEEIRREHGVLDICVAAFRELRGASFAR